MIVRLKDNIPGTYKSLRPFQFYDSPIKSAHTKPPTQGRWWRFNSMIVRLKAIRLCFTMRRRIGFNSMIVRLKARLRGSAQGSFFKFQFYDSPIKRPSSSRKVSINSCFNSMIVRLKVHVTFILSVF